MSLIPARELRNHMSDVIERARSGEEVTITVNGVPTATLAAIKPAKKAFLTLDELRALGPKPGAPVAQWWDHELDGDSTDDLEPKE